jgi:amino acid adenylation domain-containing protein
MTDQVGFELSTQQSRILNAGPAGMVLRNQCTVEVDGALVPQRLRDALDAAVARHEILRTTFVRPAGLRMPLQAVNATGTAGWEEVDLSGLPEGDRQERFARLRDEHAAELDLEQGPLVHALLARRGQANHVLLLTAPAALLDARSLRLLAAEVLAGTGSDDPLQYGDYATWQAEQLEGRGPAKDDGADSPATALSFAGDPGGSTFDVPVRLDAGTVRALSTVGDEPQSAWLALWATAIARLTGDHEPTIALAVDGRVADELGDALGAYARSVAIRADLGPGTTFTEVAQRVAEARREARDDEERSGASRPRTAVGLAFSSRPEPLGGDGAFGRVADERGSQDPLQAELHVIEDAAGPELFVRADAAAVEFAEAERIARHLARLAGSAAADPSADVWALEIVPDEDRARLLGELAQGPAAPAGLVPVHRLFELWAQRTPDAPAVALGDEQLSYAQLDARANAIAHALRERGVGPDTAVALLADRSPQLIAAVLGVLKAGGAYLPLNPDQPPARLAFQVQDAGASIVITDAAHEAQAAALPAEALRADVDLASAPAGPPQAAGELDDVVYVIYTSGSTGVPKGVETTHRGLANYVAAIGARLDLEEAGPQRFGVVTTVSTDLGNTSIFPALATGGTLQLVPVDAAMDGAAYQEHTAVHAIDILKITPSHLSALLAGAGAAALPGRQLILGGEPCPVELVERVRSLAPCAVLNHYGPTETTIGSLTHAVECTEGAAPGATVPIGRPLAGTDVHVVDEQLRLVPLGVPGELLIGGAGLARGYRNQPEQTAERFVAHPFREGARAYRTGDVVRMLADGNVEFVARVDGQVKIRGFRVEIGEVEAVLGRHPAAGPLAVVLREDRPGDQRLVAYVTGGASADELRTLAREHLPEYMVPSAFVALDALPLTPNGKLDRAALPAPEAAAAVREYVAPRDEIEETLAAIWVEALGVEQVGVHDDFFELGGHSLLATQVIARIRAAYGIQLPLHSLFTAPRVSDLALAVTAAREPAADEDDGELAALLEELEGLSEEEAERLLSREAPVRDEA